MVYDTRTSGLYKEGYKSRCEIELSEGWAAEHPDLFTKLILSFKIDHPVEDWKHLISLHTAGSIKLIALRRDIRYDQTKDYLREIGTE